MGGTRSRTIGVVLFFFGAILSFGAGEKAAEYPNDIAFILSTQHLRK